MKDRVNMMVIKPPRSDIFDLISNPINFPTIIFNIDEMGPGIVYKDFDELQYSNLNQSELDQLMTRLAISYISAIGQGQSYIEGVYDLPAGELKNYRLILIAFLIGNTGAEMRNINSIYYQMAIFVPVPLSHLLPSFSLFEDFILAIVKKNLQNSYFLTVDNINNIKKEILSLLTFVTFETMKRCNC